MSSRRIRTVGAGLAALASLVVLGGCATGSSDTLPDGDLGSEDASVSHDGHVSEGGISFKDTGFPGVDAGGRSDTGGGDDAGQGADTGPGDDSGGPTDDSGTPGDDSGTDSGGTCPPGMTGPGCADCATGFHLCGATCTADETNDPSVGCSQSCGGGPCAAMGSAIASCSAAGECTYACGSGTVMCSGTCAECCTDSDCSSEIPLCSGGTCEACPSGTGTCVTACDTDFTSNDNCGACGNSCDYNVVLCIAVGIDCGCTDEGGGDYECD